MSRETIDDRGISRSQFLTGAGATAASLASLSSGSLQAATGNTVVIVGAGVAGLAAARRLSKSGDFKVIVVEGRRRIGGRIWTDRSLGPAIDMGAAWIHGIKRNPIYKIAKKENAALFATDPERMDIYTRGRALTDREWEELEKASSKLMRELYSLKRSAKHSASIAEVMPGLLAKGPRGVLGRALRYMVASNIEIEYASDLDELSLRYFDEDEEYSGDHVLFKNGYDVVPDSLARGLDVRLGHRVRTIEYDSGRGVKIHTDRGVIPCDWTIVTLPLGVLQKNSVTFRPDLPAAKTSIIRRLGMGTMNKVALEFPRRFWPKELHYFGETEGSPAALTDFFNLEPLGGRPILVALSRGDFARSMDRKSPRAAAALMHEKLKIMFGNNVRDRPPSRAPTGAPTRSRTVPTLTLLPVPA